MGRTLGEDLLLLHPVTHRHCGLLPKLRLGEHHHAFIGGPRALCFHLVDISEIANLNLAFLD